MAILNTKAKHLFKRGLIVAGAAFCLIEIYYIGQVLYYSKAEITTSAYIESERERLGKVTVRPVPLLRVSNNMIRAVIAAEDVNFLDHNGIEWKALQTAFISNVLEGEAAPGGSTITQQLIKNLFLSHKKSYIRKAQEIVLAKVMEATWSKGRILQTYLNVAEFGQGIFGVEAAAQHYYGQRASTLNHWQSLWLACILSNPRYYEKRGSTRWLEIRMRRVSRAMTFPEVYRVNNRLQ